MKRFILIIFIICICITIIGCEKASDYSDEEHLNIISKIIEEKYLGNNVTYKVRPLYNYNDELAYFVVDFSNSTYMYIKIHNKDQSFLWGPSLYLKDNVGSNSGPWKKNKFIVKDDQLVEEYEEDENGNAILYYNSHFEIANISEDTKCYLIEMRNSSNNLIPSIKVDNKWLNLITMETFDLYSSVKYPSSGISFIPKKSFNL